MSAPRPVWYYLRLRLLGLWRFFPHHSIHPVIGVLFTLGIVSAFLALLFVKTVYAPWIVSFLPAALFRSAQTTAVDSLLGLHLTVRQRLYARFGEAMLLVVPFMVLLAVKACWLQAGVSIILAGIAAVPQKRRTLPIPTLPSPFPAMALEWHAAWRRFLPFFVLYGLSFIPAIAVRNGAFAALGFGIVMYLVGASYGEVEAPELLVLHRGGPLHFLRQKAILALKGYIGLAAPLLVCTGLFFRELMPVTGIIVIIGAMMLAGCIALKYLFYPGTFSVQLTQALFFALTLAALLFPPLLLLQLTLCIYAWFRAGRVLRTYLPC